MHVPTASSKPGNHSISMPDPTADDPLVVGGTMSQFSASLALGALL